MEKQKNQDPDSAITYHNKDVISKLQNQGNQCGKYMAKRTCQR